MTTNDNEQPTDAAAEFNAALRKAATLINQAAAREREIKNTIAAAYRQWVDEHPQEVAALQRFLANLGDPDWPPSVPPGVVGRRCPHCGERL